MKEEERSKYTLEFKDKIVGNWVMEQKGVDDSCWEVKSEQNSRAVRLLRMQGRVLAFLRCVFLFFLCNQSQPLTTEKRRENWLESELTVFPFPHLPLLLAQPRG